jgi:hypothetical protein
VAFTHFAIILATPFGAAVVGVPANDHDNAAIKWLKWTSQIIGQHAIIILKDFRLLARTPTIAGNSKVFTLRSNIRFISMDIV